MGGPLSWGQDLAWQGFKGHVRFDQQTKRKMAGAPTEEVVPGQGVQDPRRPDQVAHGGREGGGINADGDKGVPDVDVSEEAVVPLEEDAVGRKTVPFKPKGLYHFITPSPSTTMSHGKLGFFYKSEKEKNHSLPHTIHLCALFPYQPLVLSPTPPPPSFTLADFISLLIKSLTTFSFRSTDFNTYYDPVKSCSRHPMI